MNKNSPGERRVFPCVIKLQMISTRISKQSQRHRAPSSHSVNSLTPLANLSLAGGHQQSPAQSLCNIICKQYNKDKVISTHTLSKITFTKHGQVTHKKETEAQRIHHSKSRQEQSSLSPEFHSEVQAHTNKPAKLNDRIP